MDPKTALQGLSQAEDAALDEPIGVAERNTRPDDGFAAAHAKLVSESEDAFLAKFDNDDEDAGVADEDPTPVPAADPDQASMEDVAPEATDALGAATTETPDPDAQLEAAIHEVRRAGLTEAFTEGWSNEQLLEAGNRFGTVNKDFERMKGDLAQAREATQAPEGTPVGAAPPVEAGTATPAAPAEVGAGAKAFADEFGDGAASAVQALVKAEMQPLQSELAQYKAQVHAQNARDELAMRTELGERFAGLDNDATWELVGEKAKAIAPGYSDIRTLLTDAARLVCGEASPASVSDRQDRSNGTPTRPGRVPPPKADTRDDREMRAYDLLERGLKDEARRVLAGG